MIVHTLVNELLGNEIPMNNPNITPQAIEKISLIVSADIKELELQNMLQELDKLLWNRQQQYHRSQEFNEPASKVLHV